MFGMPDLHESCLTPLSARHISLNENFQGQQLSDEMRKVAMEKLERMQNEISKIMGQLGTASKAAT